MPTEEDIHSLHEERSNWIVVDEACLAFKLRKLLVVLMEKGEEEEELNNDPYLCAFGVHVQVSVIMVTMRVRQTSL